MRQLTMITACILALLLSDAILQAAPSPVRPNAGMVQPLHQANPLLTNFYDGANRQKLAESTRGSATEEDLLLFLLLNGDKRPAIYDDFMNEREPKRKAQLQAELREKINDYYYHLAFAEMDQGPNLTDFEQKKADASLCPVIEFVWLDRIIRPRIEVTPGEMQLYYRNHPEEFITPRMVRVRYIFRPLDPSLTRDEVDAEEKLMDSLREVLTQHPEKFAEAARQYSRAQNAENGGEIPPFAEGEYFPQFEKMAFNLGLPGEISSIFSNNEGLFLVQLIEHIMPDAIDFETAREQVRKSALKQELTHMARYEVSELDKKAVVENRFPMWQDLRDEDTIAMVEERSITKGDFWKIFPSIIDVMGNVSNVQRNYFSKRYIECELMRYDLMQRNLWDDPRLARAQQMAEMIIKAERVEKRHLKDKPIPEIAVATPEIPKPAVMLSGTPRVRLFKVEGRIVDPKKLDATTLISLRETLPQVLQNYIAKAPQPVVEETDLDRKSKVPAAVRGINAIENEHFEFEWKDLGWINPLTKPEMMSTLIGVTEGQFTSVQSSGDSASAYYVAAERKLSAEEAEQLELRVRRGNAAKSQEATIAMFRENVVQTNNVSYLF